jgi:DNA-binding LacI/PurR family transcriptional regulator
MQTKNPKSKTGKRVTTIRDIARLSNCSPTTVSFVLNNHPQARNIPEVTRRRVFDAVEELDYVPNAYAKMLRQGNPHTIGVIAFDMTDPYCTTVLRGIGQYLNEHNFFYQLADVQNDLSLLGAFFQNARARNIEGILGIVNSLAIEPATLAEFFGKRTIFVSIGRGMSGLKIQSVILNNLTGARLAVRHLYDLGHREIAFLLGPKVNEESQIRGDGIRATCRELGLACRDELIETIDEFPATPESGGRAIWRIMARRAPFTAVCCYDDMIAYGVIWELNRAGRGVPGEVSVIGFDDLWPSRVFNPPLTTIHQPMEEMGAEGAKLIVGLLTNSGKRLAQPTDEIVLEPTLIVRETTAPPPRTPSRPARHDGRSKGSSRGKAR